MAGLEVLRSPFPARSTPRVFAKGVTPQFNGAYLGKPPLTGSWTRCLGHGLERTGMVAGLMGQV